MAARTAAGLELIDETFAEAHDEGNRAVVVMMQADMFDATVGTPSTADFAAFTPIVRKLAERAADFAGPVYLFNGDSHVYNADQPLAAGSSWLSFLRRHHSGDQPDSDHRRRLDRCQRLPASARRAQQPGMLTWAKVSLTPTPAPGVSPQRNTPSVCQFLAKVGREGFRGRLGQSTMTGYRRPCRARGARTRV